MPLAMKLATATAARSNGMLAAAYPAYFWARSLAFEFEWRPTKTAPPRVRARGWRCGAKAVSSFFVVLMESCVIVVPFVAYLHYWNSKFCTSNKGGVVADDAVFHFNPCMDDARLVFNAGGSVPEGPCVVPEWCDNNNVLPAEEEEEVSEGGVQSFFWFMWPPSNMYSHIQTKYWNVGSCEILLKCSALPVDMLARRRFEQQGYAHKLMRGRCRMVQLLHGRAASQLSVGRASGISRAWRIGHNTVGTRTKVVGNIPEQPCHSVAQKKRRAQSASALEHLVVLRLHANCLAGFAFLGARGCSLHIWCVDHQRAGVDAPPCSKHCRNTLGA